MHESMLFFGVWISIWTLGCTALAINVFGAWKNVFRDRSGTGKALFMSFFSIPFFLAEIFVITMIGFEIGFLPVLLILVILVMNLFFYEWMKAPTLYGREMMDKIEGFKMYLSVAEGSRIQMMGAPEKDIGLYEKYLPYAIALDVENTWTRQFNQVIEQVSSSESGYQPRWYQSSRPFSVRSAGRMTGALGSALSSAVSSSSGSRGGGFSGGGRGGGGGGGR